jgi:hypothetical protein
MIGLLFIVAGVTLIGASAAAWCFDAARQRKALTPADLWEMHHRGDL